MKKSLIKIFISLFLIAFATNIPRIPGTNSFFTSKATVKGNAMTAGYWVGPTVMVLAPKNGDDLTAGSLFDINWKADSSDASATDSMGMVVDYTCDGIGWKSIAQESNNNEFLFWTVPNENYNNCVVRVTATDSHGLTNSGESGKFKIVSPFNAGDVVINEVMWMGTFKNHNDQWIELKNTTSHDIDIKNWNISGAAKGNGHLEIAGDDKDKSDCQNNNGDKYIIPANGYFLITRLDDKKTEVKDEPDLVKGSLKFYHDYEKNGSIVLEDEYGNVIDQTPDANSSSWPAGWQGILFHLSMERNNSPGDGGEVGSWHTCIDPKGFTKDYWKDDGFNCGTPGQENLSKDDLNFSDFGKMDKNTLDETTKDGKFDSVNSINPFGNVGDPANDSIGVGGTGATGTAGVTGDTEPNGTAPTADAPATDTSGDGNATDVKNDSSADAKPADADTPKDDSGENSSESTTTE